MHAGCLAGEQADCELEAYERLLHEALNRFIERGTLKRWRFGRAFLDDPVGFLLLVKRQLPERLRDFMPFGRPGNSELDDAVRRMAARYNRHVLKFKEIMHLRNREAARPGRQQEEADKAPILQLIFDVCAELEAVSALSSIKLMRAMHGRTNAD